MDLPEPQNWNVMENTDWRYVWKHEDYPLWMIVSYQPDHYDEDGEQVMRVRGRATYGTKESDIGNITFGQYKVVLCDEDTDKNEAFTQVISWANDWMKSYKYGKFDLDF